MNKNVFLGFNPNLHLPVASPKKVSENILTKINKIIE